MQLQLRAASAFTQGNSGPKRKVRTGAATTERTLPAERQPRGENKPGSFYVDHTCIGVRLYAQVLWTPQILGGSCFRPSLGRDYIPPVSRCHPLCEPGEYLTLPVSGLTNFLAVQTVTRAGKRQVQIWGNKSQGIFS